jgi:FkbM family methyltransferase
MVHAFDPYPPAIRWLEKNIQLNGLEGKVKLANVALGNAVGETDLFVPPARYGTTLETSASINPDYHEQVGQKLRVPMLTVDEFVRREVGARAVNVMLIDVEGFEHSVLEGAEAVLQTSRPVVAFEVLTRSTTQVALLERIRKKHGYRCLVMEPLELKVSEPVQPCGIHTNQLMVPEDGLDMVMVAARMAGVKFNRKV